MIALAIGFYLLAGIAWGIMFSNDFKAELSNVFEPEPQEITILQVLAFFFGLFCWPLLAAAWAWTRFI